LAVYNNNARMYIVHAYEQYTPWAAKRVPL